MTDESGVAKVRREMDSRVESTLSSKELLVLLLQSELIYVLSGLLWQPEAGTGCRPRKHPDWVGWLFLPFITKEGSQRKADRFLRDNWELVEDAARLRFGDEAMWLAGPGSFNRHNFHHFRRILQRSDLGPIMDAYRDFNIAGAQACGLLNEHEGSVTHPALSRTANTDGKVVASISKAAKGARGRIYGRTPDGERILLFTYPMRYDPTAGWYRVGGDEGRNVVFGNKFAHLGIRGEDENVRFMLDLVKILDGDEAAETVRMALRLRAYPLVGDRLQAVVADMAWRGVHHRLMLQAGVLSVSGVHAAVKAKDSQPRVPKRSVVQGMWRPAGSVTAEPRDVLLRDGHPHLREVDVDGEIHERRLDRVQTKRKGPSRRDGAYTWYSVYAVPDDLGGGRIWLRHLADEDDQDNGMNREENLRVISPLDPDFAAIHGRRQDSESLNDLIEQTLWKKRAHSYGIHRQFWDLLGLGMAMAVTAPEAYRRAKRRRRGQAA